MQSKIICSAGGFCKSGGGFVTPGGGLVDPISTSPSTGPNLLADFNYATPVSSWQTGRTGFSSAYATDEWLMQSHTAGAYANNVGSETLVDSTGYRDQAAVGIWDGSGYANRSCWESTATVANTDELVASGTTAGDSDNEDFAFRLVFRCRDAIPSNDWLISKYASSLGWGVYMAAGTLKFFVRNGTLLGVSGPGTWDNDVGDGAWHYLTGWYDQSAQMIYLKGDNFSEVSLSTAGTASITNSAPLVVNGNGDAGSQGVAHLQVAYAGVAVGESNAQSMYDENFWRHAEDPGAHDDAKTALTTISRTSLISVPVSATQVAHFSGGTGTSAQMPIGYNSNFSDTNNLGLYCNSAVTNLVPYSRASTGATNLNVTATDNAADAADGFRAATTLAATANGGYQERVCVVAASTQYTGSIYIEESTVGVQGRVVAYDLSNGAEIAATAYTATSSPVDKTVTFTTPVGCTSVGLRCEITTSGETVIADFWQLNLGDARGAIINTSGSSAVLAAPSYLSSGNHINNQAGEIETTFIPEITQDFYLWYGNLGTSANSHIRYILGTLKPRSWWYDNAGGTEENSAHASGYTRGAESVDRDLWDVSGLDSGAYETIQYANGTRDNGSTMPLEGTIDAGYSDGINIASRGGSYMDGFIQRIRSWDGPNAL